MRGRSLEGVVFDLGGVWVDFDSDLFFQAYGKKKGKSARQFVEAIEAWGMYDLWERGGCSEREFFASFRTWVDLPSLRLAEFRKDWNGIFLGGAPDASRMIRKLKERRPIFILSNTTDTHFRYLKQRFRWLNDFDRLFTSFGLKSRKPERVIFERMLQKIPIPPERLLFVDDRKENLAVARSIGFRIAHCPAPAELKRVLDKRGLLS